MENRLLGYLYFFNLKKDYFECHEYGESLWLDTGRPIVLKGLIQAAVCLYHLENGNVKGGWRMWQRARAYLMPSTPVYEGMNLARLIQDIDAVFKQVPTGLYSQVVDAKQIAELNLPRVSIQLVDANVSRVLETWEPRDTDLEEGGSI